MLGEQPRKLERPPGSCSVGRQLLIPIACQPARPPGCLCQEVGAGRGSGCAPHGLGLRGGRSGWALGDISKGAVMRWRSCVGSGGHRGGVRRGDVALRDVVMGCGAGLGI